MSQSDLNEALILAIKKGYMNIIKYFFKTLVNQNFGLNSQNSIEILTHCFANDSNEILDYLIENINKLHLFDIDSLCTLLAKTTKHQNVEAYKTISELIYQSNPKSDFTSLFSKASVLNLKDLICYFIDRKYIKNDFDLAEKIIKDGSIDLDIYKLLINNIDSRNKKRMLNIIDKVIKKCNKPFIKYLLDENAPLDDSLISAVYTKDLEIVELILQKNCEPSYINKITKNETALFAAVKNNNLPIIKRLLSLPGINPNIYCQNYMTPLILAGCKLKIEAFDALLEYYGDKIKEQKDQLNNIIKYIISYYPDGYTSKTTKNKTAMSNNKISSELSTILTKIIKLNCIDLNFSIHLNFYDIDNKAQSTTLLFYACRINEINVVEALIESDSIDVNIYDPETGNTPLIESVKNHNINIAKLLIKNPKTKINIRNSAGHSALVEAAKSFRINKEIFDFLINDEKFNEEESNINYAFFISCQESLFAFKSLNVSYIPLNIPISSIKNIDNKSIIITPIIRAILLNDNELLDSIVNHPSYVKDVFQLINAIYIIISENNKDKFELFSKVFKLLEEFDIDINSPVFSGNCILIEAIKMSVNHEIISKILNYPGFDSQKSNILLAFNLSYNFINDQNDISKMCMKTKVMDVLYDYDIEHNHLIDLTSKKNGSSLLSKIYSTIFSELDPNEQIINEYPFKYAIENNLYILSLCLIESNKIDFEKQYFPRKKANSSYHKRPKYTYLHTAASLGRTRIVQEILSRHLIDINVVNDLGSTPLMEACKNLQIECVKLLFKYDDLDFLKKDDNERDAIYFVKHLNNIPNPINLDEQKENPIKDQITNKSEYLSELLKFIEEKKSTVDAFKSNNKITLDDLKDIRNISSLSMLDTHSISLKLMNPQNKKNSDEEKSLKKILKTDNSNTKIDTNSTTNTATKTDTNSTTNSTTKTDTNSTTNTATKTGTNSTTNSTTNTETKIGTNTNPEVKNDELPKFENSSDKIASLTAKKEHNTIKPHNDRYEKILKRMNERQPKTAAYEPVISSNKEKLYQKYQQNSFNNEFKPSFHNNNNNIIPKKLNHLVFDISNESQISNKDDSIETRIIDSSKLILNQKNSNSLNSNKEETVKTETKISKTKFKIYSESFSENPDPNFYQKVQNTSEKVEINKNKSQQKFEILSSEIFKNSSEKELIARPNKFSKFYNRKEEVDDEFLFDDIEQNQLSFDQQQIQNRNQFMLMQVQQQQQQQWLQMIQLNNQFQAQMFMKMMNQQNVNQKKHHHSKKKKKGNKK